MCFPIVSGYSLENGAPIRQFEDKELLNQRFDVVDLANGFFAIMPGHSGAKAVDLASGSSEDGAFSVCSLHIVLCFTYRINSRNRVFCGVFCFVLSDHVMLQHPLNTARAFSGQAVNIDHATGCKLLRREKYQSQKTAVAQETIDSG